MKVWSAVASGFTLLRKATRDFNYMFLLCATVCKRTMIVSVVKGLNQMVTADGAMSWSFIFRQVI